MRSLPSRTYSPSPAARMAVRNRKLVPERRRSSRADLTDNGPPTPYTSKVDPCVSTLVPSAFSALIMTSESSATRAPVIRVAPAARAASGSARFDRLLEPGTAMLPTTRRCGPTVSTSGRLTDTRRGYDGLPNRAALAWDRERSCHRNATPDEGH